MKKMPLAIGMYALAIACTVASAATPKVVITGRTKVIPGRSFMVDASKSTFDKPLVWSYTGPDVPIAYMGDSERPGKAFAYCDDPVAGVYTFKVKAKGVPDGEKEMDADSETWTVVVEDPNPPKPPTPPTPNPDVNPPQPPIPPTPSPQVTDKLRVLFFYETSDPLPPGAYEAMRSPEIRSYLDTHTMADGKTFAWRMWDKDMLLFAETPGWMNAYNQAKAKLPPAVPGQVFTPIAFAFKDTEFLDAIEVKDVATTLEFLKRYGGR